MFEISKNGHPEDFVGYYAMLTGEDPDKVMEGLVKNVVDYVTEFANLTDREKRLMRENRKNKFDSLVRNKNMEFEKKKTEKSTTRQKKLEYIHSKGLTAEEVIEAAEEIERRVLDKEEGFDEYSEEDIVNYAVQRKFLARVADGFSGVNGAPDPSEDREFFDSIAKAVARAEALSGEELNRSDVAKVVKAKMEKDHGRLSESLSKKVSRHEKSGKTISKKVSSRKQEEGDDVLLSDHRAKMEGW